MFHLWIQSESGSRIRRPVYRRASVELPALDCDAVQEAAFALVVVDRVVPGRAVVPEGERAFPPLEAAGEFGPDRVPVEVVEQRARFLIGPAIEANRESRIDVEGPASGVGMADDDRMHGVLRRQLGVANAAHEVPPPCR